MSESVVAAPHIAPPAGPVLRAERIVRSDLATVWKALTDPEDTAFWFAEVRCELRAGAPLCVSWDDGDCVYGEVVACEPESVFAYTWSWQGIGNVSLVTWRVTQVDDGIAVTLTHQLADAFDRDEYAAGWRHFLQRLADLCEGEAVPQRKMNEAPGAVEMAIDLPAPTARVWDALVDETQIGHWFTRAHLVPALGGAVAFFAPRTGRVLDRGTVTAFEPGAHLAFTWTEPGWPADTSVDWTLTPIPGGTRLAVRHGGWNHLPLALARGDRPGKTAWRTALADLRAALADDGKVPSDGFRLTRVLQGGPESAWRLLTHTAAVRQWVGMPDEDVATVAYEATLGGEVRIEDATGDAWIGRVTACEPGHRIVWTLRAGGIGPECTFAFEVTPEAPGYLFGARLACTARGFELEHDRAAAERRAMVWMLHLQELASGEEPTRVERRGPDTIALTVDLAAPTTRIFALLTRDEEAARWMCEHADIGAGMGGNVTWHTRDAEEQPVVERGRVVEFRPGERFAVAFTRAHAGWGAPVVATFDLRPLKGGTRLRFEAAGWDALPLSRRDDERAGTALRWRRALGLLRDIVQEEAAREAHVAARRAERADDDMRFGVDVPSRLPYRIEEDEDDPDAVKPRRSSVGHARAGRPPRDEFDAPRPPKKKPAKKPAVAPVDRGTRGIARDPSRMWKPKPEEGTKPAAAPRSQGGRPSARPAQGAKPVAKAAPAGKPAKKSAFRGGPRPATPRNSRDGFTVGGKRPKPKRGPR